MAHFIIGLTGGIGSGKTTVSQQFEHLGIDVIDADLISHHITAKGQPALQKIAEHFGTQSINEAGELNRAWLRQHIFSNPSAKQWLENLLHPMIAQATHRALDRSNSAYTLLVSPLLIESGYTTLCQRIVVVDIPVETQLQRTVERDHCARNTVAAIIEQQIDRQQRLATADDIIDNSGTLDDLQQQIEALHAQYIDLAQAFKASVTHS